MEGEGVVKMGEGVTRCRLPVMSFGDVTYSIVAIISNTVLYI